MKNHEISENQLSKERNLLAAERTFSAWIRTALTGMAGGLAILKLIEFKSEFHKIIAHFIGEGLILWGCAVVIFAAIDYKKIQNKLNIKTKDSWYQVGFFIIIAPLLFLPALLIWVTLP